jgi:outer membrane protein OmpA-like peptidoglycan-associated protein
VKLAISKWIGLALICVVSGLFFAALRFGSSTATSDIHVKQDVKVAGVILSRDGDMVRIKDKKSRQFVIVNITDNTKIERKKHRFLFLRHTDMDVTTMVPGLMVEAEAVRNPKGQLDAIKISYTPDQFAIKNAQKQQVANKAQDPHGTAYQGIAAAGRVQSSDEYSQNSADQASLQAQDVGPIESADAIDISMLNHRVSDLDDYMNEFEIDVFFAGGSAMLSEKTIKDLDNLADIAKSLDKYMIEIGGHTSNTLGAEVNQRLSEDRAAAVARYFQEVKNVPMRRVLVPVGYGASHPAVNNRDPKLRGLNDRVDIKILVNKSKGEGL